MSCPICKESTCSRWDAEQKMSLYLKPAQQDALDLACAEVQAQKWRTGWMAHRGPVRVPDGVGVMVTGDMVENRMKLPPYIMVFDIESMGFQGPAFSVGCVVLDTVHWRVLDHRKWTCDPDKVPATVADRAWVDQNCGHLWDKQDYCESPARMRELFWGFWTYWKAQGAWLAADVPWPVEANFLSVCVVEVPERQEQAPYPLLDIASLGFAKGWDPLASHDRVGPHEHPEHDPLADSHQSGRLLKEILSSTSRNSE